MMYRKIFKVSWTVRLVLTVYLYVCSTSLCCKGSWQRARYINKNASGHIRR